MSETRQRMEIWAFGPRADLAGDKMSRKLPEPRLGQGQSQGRSHSQNRVRDTTLLFADWFGLDEHPRGHFLEVRAASSILLLRQTGHRTPNHIGSLASGM